MKEFAGVEAERYAADVALGLPGATTDQPFGPDVEVYRVAGKIFMLTGGRLHVTLKCPPHEALELRAEFPSITPGYHMNKRHWITVEPGPGITPEVVEELVHTAYDALLATLPRTKRPFVPRDL
ncbi:MAG TPA: MmcQ/YjbR family DNA-binding protein [Actinomycetales bacterium]|nr:MmcQ/YjbR family DNA-binding protein [Actinomycetales bacterium]